MTYLTDGERASFDRSNVKESKQWVTEIILVQVFPITRISMAGKYIRKTNCQRAHPFHFMTGTTSMGQAALLESCNNISSSTCRC